MDQTEKFFWNLRDNNEKMWRLPSGQVHGQ